MAIEQRHRAMALWSLVAVIVLVAACAGPGGSSTTNGEPSPATTGETQVPADTTTPAQESELPDPCSLLQVSDIDAATGLSFGEGSFNDGLSSEFQVVCDWLTDGGEFASVQVLIVGVGGAYETAREGAANVYTLVDLEIAGADRAYGTEEGSLIGMEIGEMFIQVAYIPPGPGNVLDQTELLASMAAVAA